MSNEEKNIYNEKGKICQSCGFPLTSNESLESLEGSLIILSVGTEEDGSASEDFCKYCYDKGDFVQEMTMEEMISSCAPTIAETHSMELKEAKKQMEEFFPTLKRWGQK